MSLTKDARESLRFVPRVRHSADHGIVQDSDTGREPRSRGPDAVLSVCPTPIGNLGDITLRTLDVLRAADLIACEDTRRTRRLLDHFAIQKPLVSFFEHNEVRRLDMLLGELAEGRQVALVSDAGMPGLSDPGFTLVRACVERGLPVTVLPGASAVDTALVVSGLPTDRFTFVGFLPRGPKQIAAGGGRSRRRRGDDRGVRFGATGRQNAGGDGGALARAPDGGVPRADEAARGGAAGHRSPRCGPELDGRERVRGEIVLVFGARRSGARACRRPGSRVRRRPNARGDSVRPGAVGGAAMAVRAMLDRGMGVKEAAGVVAGLTGIAPRDAYRMVQAVKDDGSPSA